MFQRRVFMRLRSRLGEPRHLVQVVAGPRQAGKTTLARQVMAALAIPSHYASADEPTLRDRRWIEDQWEQGRSLARERGSAGQALLVFDEIQKVRGWAEVVRALWDEDTEAGLFLKVLLQYLQQFF